MPGHLMAFQTLANLLQVRNDLEKIILWLFFKVFLGYPIIPPQINQNDSAASAPEEGRLVRVGNMLQIVPESKTATIASSAAPSTAATANLTPPIGNVQLSVTFRIFSPEIKVVNSIKSGKPQHFHEFFTQIFLTIFLVKSKLSAL